jgi:outer membrane protein assembly factor BamB
MVGRAPTGRLHALELETGKLKWKEAYGPEFTSRFDGTRSTPNICDGRVIFSSGKKNERSIMKTGTVLTPTYRDGYLAVAVNGELTMLKLSDDSRSFHELWRKTGKENVETRSQVVLLDGKVFGMGTIAARHIHQK